MNIPFRHLKEAFSTSSLISSSFAFSSHFLYYHFCLPYFPLLLLLILHSSLLVVLLFLLHLPQFLFSFYFYFSSLISLSSSSYCPFLLNPFIFPIYYVSLLLFPPFSSSFFLTLPVLNCTVECSKSERVT